MNTVVGFKVTHYMNTQHTQAIRSVIFKRYKSRIYWPTRKIKIAEDDPEDDGTKEEEEVYGGEVEDKEHEHDEYEAHKPARVYDEPLKNRQSVANRDSLVFLREYTKIPVQSILMSQRKQGNDGDSSDAEIAGRVSLVSSNTQTDDKIAGLEGTGGQGVLAIPNVYNGWVQTVPSIWKDILTEEQQNPK